MSGLSGFQEGLSDANTQFQTIYTSITQETQSTQTHKLAPIKDTSSVSEAHAESIQLLYKALASNPDLPIPDAVPLDMDIVNKIIQNYPDQVLAVLNDLPVVEDKFPSEVEELLNALSDEELARMGNGDPVKGKQQIRFAILHPNSKFPPELKELATELRDKASAASGSTINETFVAIEDKAISTIAEFSVQYGIMGSNLTESEKKQLYFAHEVPEAKASLPPHLQAELQKIEAKGYSEIQDKFGFPDDWLPPPNSQDYEANIGSQIGLKTEQGLQSLLDNKEITRAQYNELRTLLYTNEATPNAANLRPLLEKLLQENTKSLQSDYGFPDNYSPKIDGSSYQAMLNGAFLAEFNRQLDNPSYNLNAEQKALLKEALVSPEAAKNLPADLKAILQSLEAAGTAKVAKLYGVSGTWAPDVEALAVGMTREVTNPNIAHAQIALNQLKEWVSQSNKLVDEMEQTATARGKPLPPFAQLIKDYLKTVSLALIGMQEMLFELSITDANMADLMNKIQNDDKIAQLDKQAKELKEVLEKQKKMASLGPLKAIFQWIINILLMVILGPIGVALMLNSIAQTIKKGKETGNMGKAFMQMNVVSDLGKTISDVGKAIGGPAGKFFERFATLMSTVLLMIFAPGAFLLDMLIGEATFIKQLAKGFGADKKTAEKVAMAIQMAFQVVAGIALCAFTGGASIELMAANFAKSAGEAALSALQILKPIIQPVLNVLANIASKLAPALEGPIKGAMDAAIKAVESFIKSADDAINGFAKGMKQLDNAEIALREAKQVEETAKASLEQVKALEAARVATPEEVAAAEQALTDATANVAKADAQLIEIGEAIKEASTFGKRMISGAKTTATFAYDAVQAGVSINNNILQAQIARIKGMLEAAMILVEQFVKLMKDLVAKLMDMVKSIGQDIKQIGEQHQQMFAQASQTITNMFSGA